MSGWRRIALAAIALAAGAGAPSRASGGDDPSGPRPRPRPGSKPSNGKPASPARGAAPAPADVAGGDATRCASCHVTGGWEQVRFNHDPTGFPLRGAHSAVTCNACHPRGFDVPVADTCAGCHRDRHAGEFGTQCEGCHEDKSWRALFQADAHRRTLFPLVGKHGLIPCQQCHGNMRDRTFTGAPIACASCHQADYERTRATALDHAAAGFSRDCQTCHTTWRFWPARVVAHEGCWPIAGGPHQSIRCLSCHTSLTTISFTACATDIGNYTCSGCHEHNCAKSDAQHANVGATGYQCTDGKCFGCHMNGRR